MTAPLEGLREADDGDAEALAALIGGVYAEYPGCVLDLPGVDHDLTAIRSHLAAQGGRLWVLDGGGGLQACVGYAPASDGRVELKRLYVHPGARRGGVGSALTGLVLDVAAGLQATAVDLWSDSRFTDAHRHYERHGWIRQAATRDLHDPSNTTEYHFSRQVVPAPPDHRVTWQDEAGRLQEAVFVVRPWMLHLRGVAHDGAWRWAATADETCRTRDVTIGSDGGPALRLTCDGQGRWWRDGRRDTDLDGCTDVDLAVTPATNTLPIRRAQPSGTDDVAVTAAWVRWPDLQVTPVQQHYRRTGTTTWRYTSPTAELDLEVDEHGIVRTYGRDRFTALSRPSPRPGS